MALGVRGTCCIILFYVVFGRFDLAALVQPHLKLWFVCYGCMHAVIVFCCGSRCMLLLASGPPEVLGTLTIVLCEASNLPYIQITTDYRLQSGPTRGAPVTEPNTNP